MPYLSYSFSTVMMAVLTSGILVLLLSLVFLNRNVMANAGSKLLALLVGIAVLRLLFPCEFLTTVNIFPPEIISIPLSVFQTPLVTIYGIHISCWLIFELIWFCGIIVRFTFEITDYLHSRNYVLKYGEDVTDTSGYREPLDRICAQYGKKNAFRVIELEGLNIPAFFHLGKPYILIPKGLAIPPEKLQYILQHEALHYFQHDHLTKPAVRLLSILYWWNPFCILLQRQMDLLLEMSVDRKVVDGDPVVRKEYADCLLYIRRQTLASAAQASDSLGKDYAFLLPSRSSDLKKRYTMLFHNTSVGKKTIVAFLLTTLTVCIYLTSYRYTLEAHSFPPEIKEHMTIPFPENTCIVQLETGAYAIFVDGICVDTTFDLTYYYQGIKIYNTKGELIGKTR